MKTINIYIGKVLIIFSISIFFQSCNINSKKSYKKHYYDSGKLKDEGWYIHDSIPVDSIFRYYENGNIYSIERRDDSGYLNGATAFYFEKGGLESLDSYIKGCQFGFASFFYRTGLAKSKVFWTSNNDRPTGDGYFYDSSIVDNINSYCFFDFSGNTINLINYDSTGKITKDIRQVLYIDSIIKVNKKGNIKDNTCFDIILIVSNPPKCKVNITIEYKAKGIVLMRDTVPRGSYYFNEKIVPNNVDSIIYFGSQYDSIKQKTMYHKTIQPIRQ